MKERPIIMSGESVRAILAGRKTQTRRIVKGIALEWLAPGMFVPEFVADPENRLCPYGVPGDRLYVKEAWGVLYPQYISDVEHEPTFWRADYSEQELRDQVLPRWRSPFHLPRSRSRLTLEVTGVRVQRLQDISEEDAKAEGALPFFAEYPNIGREQRLTSGELAADAEHRACFAVMWDEINADRATWKSNPWVWALTFRVAQ